MTALVNKFCVGGIRGIHESMALWGGLQDNWFRPVLLGRDLVGREVVAICTTIDYSENIFVRVGNGAGCVVLEMH